MRNQRENSFSDRRKTADAAKKKLLKKFEAAPKPDDPEMLAKRAEREAIAVAREQRRVERERMKKETAAREKAEAKARREAEEQARLAEEEKRAKQIALTEAERKAERDRRYAARKARQR